MTGCHPRLLSQRSTTVLPMYKWCPRNEVNRLKKRTHSHIHSIWWHKKGKGGGGGEIQAISWWNFCTPSPSSRSGQSLKSTSGNRRSSKNCKVRGKSGVVKLYLRQASLHGQDLCTTKRRHLRATALRERHSHFCAQRPSHFHFHQRAQ